MEPSLLFLINPLLQTSKKGHPLVVPQKKCRQRVECSAKKRFLIVYDHFDSYTTKASPASSLNMNDNTGIMLHLSNHSNNDKNTSIVNTDISTGNDGSNASVSSNNIFSLPMINVTSSRSNTPPPTLTTLADDGSREVTDHLGDACNSDCSDLETLTQFDRREVGPGTRTDVSPLMKMTLSKETISLRHSSPSTKGPASKRVCPASKTKEQQQQPGGCG